jgi:hypothetical protein
VRHTPPHPPYPPFLYTPSPGSKCCTCSGTPVAALLTGFQKLPAACQADEELAPDRSCAPLFSPLVCAEGQSVDAAGERCGADAAVLRSAGGSGAAGAAAGAIVAAVVAACAGAALYVFAARGRHRVGAGGDPAGASAPVQAGVAPFTSATPRSVTPVHDRLVLRSVPSPAALRSVPSPTAAAAAGSGVALAFSAAAETPRVKGVE